MDDMLPGFYFDQMTGLERWWDGEHFTNRFREDEEHTPGRTYEVEPIRKPPPLPPGPRSVNSGGGGSARPLIGLGLFVGALLAWNSGDYGLGGTLFSVFIGFMIVSVLS